VERINRRGGEGGEKARTDFEVMARLLTFLKVSLPTVRWKRKKGKGKEEERKGRVVGWVELFMGFNCSGKGGGGR